MQFTNLKELKDYLDSLEKEGRNLEKMDFRFNYDDYGSERHAYSMNLHSDIEGNTLVFEEW